MAKKLEDDYGVTDSKLNNDGSVTMTTGLGTLTIPPVDQKQEYTLKLQDGRDLKITPAEYFWEDDKYTIGDKSYVLSTNCDGNVKNCLKGDGDQINIDNKEDLKLIKNVDDMTKHRNNICRKETGENCPDVQQNYQNYWNKLQGAMRGRISALMDKYLSEILGPFFNRERARICNIYTGTDYKYVDTGTEQSDQTILFMHYPETSYQLDKEQEILDELRTAIISGKVTEITQNMFRYEINVKLIGDQTSGKWELWLKNSCDDTDSKEIWMETGSLGYGAIFDVLYAGQGGEDMIFECGVDQYCRFNQAVFKWEDQSAQFFSLAGAPACT